MRFILPLFISSVLDLIRFDIVDTIATMSSPRMIPFASASASASASAMNKNRRHVKSKLVIYSITVMISNWNCL